MPTCLGSFSLDDRRDYLANKSQLRYLSLGSWGKIKTWDVKFDLRKNLELLTLKDEDKISSRMLDDMLTWILQEAVHSNPSVLSPEPGRPLKFNFVCFRGLLTLVMATPYEYKEPWSILASRLGDTIYLWESKEEKRAKPQNAFQQEAAMWGYKFEHYLCSESKDEDPSPDEAVNTNAEFCCVVKTNLNGLSLVYGAEVDAFTGSAGEDFKTLEKFVELKTCRHVETSRQDQNFKKFKLLKWWAQSFLVGIPSVLCGFRDDKGLVSRLEHFEVKKFPSMAKEYWDGATCMNFCSQLLSFIKDRLKESNPDIHFKFDYDPRYGTVTCNPVDPSTLKRKLLPDWYIKGLNDIKTVKVDRTSFFNAGNQDAIFI